MQKPYENYYPLSAHSYATAILSQTLPAQLFTTLRLITLVNNDLSQQQALPRFAGATVGNLKSSRSHQSLSFLSNFVFTF